MDGTPDVPPTLEHILTDRERQFWEAASVGDGDFYPRQRCPNRGVGLSPFSMLMSSAYVAEGDRWLMAFHQQTIVDAKLPEG